MSPVRFLICGSGGAGLHCAHAAVAGSNNVAVCEAGLISAQTGRSEKVEWFY